MLKDTDNKFSFIRLRTLTLTFVIIIALVLYFIVLVGWNDKVNLIDLIFLATVQILTLCLYFPEGELKGTFDKIYIGNKKAYNIKATAINENHKVGDLREYCKIEYKQRLERYILRECGKIGIEKEELEFFKSKSPKDIKTLTSAEFDGKMIFFTRKQRKILYNLLYKEIKVEQNNAENILSAIDYDFIKAIKDGSITYKTKEYIRKIIMATIVALFFAYVGYSIRDGITIAIIAKLISYLASMFTTAVMSYSRGEKCTSVYKSKFYIQLSNYIDEFFEWELNTNNIIIKVEERAD